MWHLPEPDLHDKSVHVINITPLVAELLLHSPK